MCFWIYQHQMRWSVWKVKRLFSWEVIPGAHAVWPTYKSVCRGIADPSVWIVAVHMRIMMCQGKIVCTCMCNLLFLFTVNSLNWVDLVRWLVCLLPGGGLPSTWWWSTLWGYHSQQSVSRSVAHNFSGPNWPTVFILPQCRFQNFVGCSLMSLICAFADLKTSLSHYNIC